MPLSYGFQPGHGPSNNHTPASNKPPATPISAGAFSFSLSSTPGPAKKQRLTERGSVPLPLPNPSIQKSHLIPGNDVFTATPKKPITSLNSLRSPFNPASPGRVSTPPTHKRLSSVIDEQSPFISRSVKDESERDGKKVRLGDLPPSSISDLPRESPKREDEGIGVSPRKAKALKWTGSGPPPPSVQLALLLSNASASLLLFYNPLQRILYPPDKRPRSSVPSTSITPLNTAPTPLQYLLSAHLRVKVHSNGYPRGHQGVEFFCSVEHEQSNLAQPAVVGGLSETNTSNTILLILQPVPRECPKLGIEPKIVHGKIDEGSARQWMIGIWQPYTEATVGNEKVIEGDNQSEIQTRVIFASRYLIAESK